MNKRKTIRHVAIGLTLVVTVPVVLFLVLAVLIYLPPVQRFAVDRTTAILSETTGMHIRIGHIRLAFPLDLTLGNMHGWPSRSTSRWATCKPSRGATPCSTPVPCA